jgi:BioD-like phosphotransacetylase family protein
MATLYVGSPRPGAGKSALVAALAEALGAPEGSIVEGDGTPRLVVLSYRGEKTLDGLTVDSVGVILNQVPTAGGRRVEREIRPALEAAGHKLLGSIPEESGLRAARVGDLVEYLGGEVVAGHDFLDNEFQSIMVGAMSHQGGTTLPYFMRMEKKVVVTGGDRIDIHLGALGTPTQAIIATAGVAPDPVVVERAEAEGTPIISVLAETPEIVDKIGKFLEDTRFGPSKAAAMAELVRQHVDLAPIRAALGLQATAGVS